MIKLARKQEMIDRFLTMFRRNWNKSHESRMDIEAAGISPMVWGQNDYIKINNEMIKYAILYWNSLSYAHFRPECY